MQCKGSLECRLGGAEPSGAFGEGALEVFGLAGGVAAEAFAFAALHLDLAELYLDAVVPFVPLAYQGVQVVDVTLLCLQGLRLGLAVRIASQLTNSAADGLQFVLALF